MGLQLVLFSLGIFVAIYLLNAVVAKQFPRIESQKAMVFITTVILVGVFGEVLVDSIYNMLFGRPLWHYQILPVHNTYTSEYAVVLWGLYGLHMYWFHGTLKSWGVTSRKHLALILSLEAIILETLVNLAALWIFGKLIYYYTPSDLWHVTTIQNIPCYFGAGYVILASLKRFQVEPRFFVPMASMLVFVFIFLA